MEATTVPCDEAKADGGRCGPRAVVIEAEHEFDIFMYTGQSACGTACASCAMKSSVPIAVGECRSNGSRQLKTLPLRAPG